jgi:hypothetical protein
LPADHPAITYRRTTPTIASDVASFETAADIPV